MIIKLNNNEVELLNDLLDDYGYEFNQKKYDKQWDEVAKTYFNLKNKLNGGK